MPPESKRDAILRHIDEMAGVSLNHETATEAVDNAIQALKQQSAALLKAPYKVKKITFSCKKCDEDNTVEVGLDKESLAKTMAYTGKVIDEIGRFVEFAKGNPDSRPQIEVTNILASLKDDQVAQVMRWIEENEQGLIEIEGPKSLQ